VTEAIASAFSEENPTVNLSLSKTGTGGGFGNFFCAGRTDINNASRAIADAEVEQCVTGAASRRSSFRSRQTR